MLLGLGLLTTVDAQAAPIRARIALRASALAEPTLPPAWNRFLSAPDAWPMSRTPPFSPSVRGVIWQVLNGDPSLASVNPMIDYLVWRRDLNPFRFDRYHPYLGPRLGQLLTPSVTPPVLAPLTGVPVAPVVEPPITPLAPLTIPPQTVPEPNSIVMITLVSALGLWRRSRTAARSK